MQENYVDSHIVFDLVPWNMFFNLDVSVSCADCFHLSQHT